MLNKLIREVKNRGLFVNVLLATVVICSWCGDAAGQPGAEVKSMDNAEQFALLCRIYNLAKNPPIHHVDLQDHVKIVEEIDTINSSFSESKLLNETEMTVNASLTALKPTTTREAAVAQAILRRISQKAHNILDDIRRLNTTSAIENVKAVFAQVIFGGGGNESDLDKSTLSEVKGRADACGKSGLQSKGQSAGKNLVVDFFCLCAQNSDKNNGIENVCGVKVGSKDDNHSWGANTVLGSPSLWASIKKGCGNLFHRYPNSTKEGHEVLGDFLTHLKSGGVYRWGKNSILGSNRKAGMLGTSVGGDTGTSGNDLICDGKKGYAKGRQPPGGVCVYYGPDKWEENIEWLKKLKTALNTVDALNNQTTTIQRDIQKLHMLLHRAEQIYETTKVITEVQNPVMPTSLHTTAKRLTAYSAAWSNSPHAHFILLFVLL